MAKKRTHVILVIELTGDDKDTLPATINVSGQAEDSVDSEMKGRPRNVAINVTGTDTLDATVTAALAAIDTETGVGA